MAKKKTDKNGQMRGVNTPKHGQAKINWDILEKIASYRFNAQSAARMFDISKPTLESAVKEKHGCTWSEYCQKHNSNLATRLITRAVMQAENGDANMMKFMLKNITKFQENPIPEPEPIDELEFFKSDGTKLEPNED